MSEWLDRFAKGGVVATTTTLGMYLIANESARQQVFGVPFGVSAGILNGLNSVGTQIAHNYILDHIPHNERFASTESFAINGTLAFAGVPSFLYLGGNISNFSDFAKLGTITLGSEILADQVYEKALHDMIFGTGNKNKSRMPKKNMRV